MRYMFSVILAVMLLSIASAQDAAPTEVRTWMSADGKFSTRAVLLEFGDDSVVLKKESGDRITVPLERLSEKDRKYVAQQRAPEPPAPRESDGVGDLVDDPTDAVKNVTVYATRSRLSTFDEMRELATGEEARIVEGEPDNWKQVQFRWPEALITVTRMSDREFMKEHLAGFTGYVFKVLAEQEMDSDVFHLIRQIHRTNHVIGIKAEPALHAKCVDFVKKLAARDNGIIFLQTVVLDPEFRLLMGGKKKQDEQARLPTLASALERKQRSMKHLAEKDLHPLDLLPVIVTDEEVRLREAEDVARRALCLFAAAARADAARDFDAVEFLKEHDLWDAASPEERAFIEKDKVNDEDKVTFSWRYESLWTLLWALGHVDEISFPDSQCDAKVAIQIVMAGAGDGFVKQAKLRPANEILDHADLIYRAFWLVRNAVQNNKKPEKLNGSVVYERHYTLCWLVRYMDDDWDDVQPDS